jgi:transcriptional regulator with XRE-family HTH domain
MSAKDSALSLLAQGIPANQVAETIGVSESYISQLMSEEDFAAQLQTVKVQAAQEDLDYDKRIDKAEEVFLERIESKSAFANLQQSLQAFKVLNTAKRRRDSRVQTPGVQIGQIVNITVPISVLPQYKTNAQNEIVEVEGKTMVSASPKRLEEILAARGIADQLKAPQLPGITKIERAAGVLQTLDNKPERKLPKNLSNIDMADFL